MKLNTVLYQLLSPAGVLAAGGVENWQAIAGSEDPRELRKLAADQRLTRYAIMACVCIELRAPATVPGLILTGEAAGDGAKAN